MEIIPTSSEAALKARLQRIEQGVQALVEAWHKAEENRKALILSWRKQCATAQAHVAQLRQKVESALAYVRRDDPKLAYLRAAPDGSGKSR